MTQLGAHQRKLLMWVFEREQNQQPKGRKGWIGVPCSAKEYYDDAPTGSQKSSLSTSLKRLEERSLIHRHSASKRNGHMTHVKLTASGRREAQRLYENGGKSEREIYDARSGLQKWVSLHLRELNAELVAQLKREQDWLAFEARMRISSDGLSEEHLEVVEDILIFGDNDDVWTIQKQLARFEKLDNDPRLQSGSFPLDKVEEVLRHAYNSDSGFGVFLSGLKGFQERQEQLPFFAEDIPVILERFDLTVDSIPVEVYHYVDSIMVKP